MELYTEKALAKALDLTTGEIENLRKIGVISYKKGKTYALGETAAAIIGYCKRELGETQPETADYQAERALLMRAKRLDQEYETRLKEGTLHEAKDVERIVTAMLMNFKSRIMAMPSKLASRLAGEKDTAEVFSILKEATDDALNELSGYDSLFSRTDDSGEN